MLVRRSNLFEPRAAQAPTKSCGRLSHSAVRMALNPDWGKLSVIEIQAFEGFEGCATYRTTIHVACI